MPDPERPLCLSMVISEGLHRDPITGKLFLMGITNRMSLPGVPFKVPRLFAFCSLTNLKGTYEPMIQVEHEESGCTIYEQKHQPPIVATHAIYIFDISFELTPILVRDFGAHWLSVYVNDLQVMQRRIVFDPPRGPASRRT